MEVVKKLIRTNEKTNIDLALRIANINNWNIDKFLENEYDLKWFRKNWVDIMSQYLIILQE